MSDDSKAKATNRIGLTRKDYVGAESTLCTGCGHDSITNHIVSACFQANLHPYQVAKVSGIGCSSKTPTYFLSQAHGFNSLHGRMAPLATGAKAVNRALTLLGVSGDGDTASIGLGGFVHLLRRNVPIVYIIENNGVYGLTKGQFSATADRGSRLKSGEANPFAGIDICTLAIEIGCGFVARSFSGDAKQLVPLIEAALHFQGTAVIDVISPCVTFANHDGSTKSYNYVREHKLMMQELGFIEPETPIEVDYEPGTVTEVKLADGSTLLLRKLDPHAHDIKDGSQAIHHLRTSRERGEILTGLFFLDEGRTDFAAALQVTERPLVKLSETELRPPPGTLSQMLSDFR